MWIGRPTIDGVTGPGATAHWLGGVERWIRTHGWASDVLLALALLAVLGALSVGGAQGLHWQRGWLIVLVAAFVVLHLTVAFRQHAPEVAYLVASAALLVIALAPAVSASAGAVGRWPRFPGMWIGRPTIDGLTGPGATAHWLGGGERRTAGHRARPRRPCGTSGARRADPDTGAVPAVEPGVPGAPVQRGRAGGRRAQPRRAGRRAGRCRHHDRHDGRRVAPVRERQLAGRVLRRWAIGGI
jgi:hypothetical protein